MSIASCLHRMFSPVSPRVFPELDPSFNDETYKLYLEGISRKLPISKAHKSIELDERRTLYPMKRHVLNSLLSFRSVVPLDINITQDMVKLVEHNLQDLGSLDDNYMHDGQSLVRKYGVPVKILGDGSFGSTYLFESLSGEKKVIKYMKMSSSLMLRLAVGEFMSTQRLSSQYVCKSCDLLASTNNPDELILVQEYFDGTDLFDMLSQCVRFDKDLQNKAGIFKSLFEAVRHTHKMGICHNDLKPENIMVNATTFQVKLIDFGLSLNKQTAMSSQSLYECLIWGTDGYTAPCYKVGTVLKSGFENDPDLTRITEAKDIWSLACVMYNIFSSGHNLWDSCNKKDPFFNHYFMYGKLVSIESAKARFEGYDNFDNMVEVLSAMLAKWDHHRITFDEFMSSNWYKKEYGYAPIPSSSTNCESV